MKIINKKIQKRVVILHGHLFKNAGTTFDWSLQRVFKEGFVDHREDTCMRKGHDFLKPFIRDNPELKAISSHHMQFPAPKINNIDIIPAILLRHPVARIISVYNFERLQDADTIGAITAKEKSLSDYVHWRMQPDTGPTIRDFHVRYCTRLRASRDLPVSETRFKEALAFLATTPLVGIVERYDESMVAFEHYLKPFVKNIDLSYIQQNVSNEQPLSLDQRIDSVLSALDNKTRKLVLENNHFDLALYENANTLLDQRIAGIPWFNIKLRAFRKRCKQLTQPETENKPWLQQFMDWNTRA